MQLKLIFLLTLLLICSVADCQFKKGTRMIGTSVGSAIFSTGKTNYSFPNGTQGYTDNNNNWSINLSPSFGWFIQDNSVAGASLIVSSSHQKVWRENTSGVTYKKDNYHNTDFGAGIFFRYYFSTTANINPFVHAFINGGSGTTKTDGFYYPGTYTENYKGESSDRIFYNAGLNAGLTKMLNSSIGLDAFVGYVHSYSKFTTKTVATSNVGGIITSSEYEPTQKFSGNGVTIGIGLQVFLNCK